MDVLTIWFAVHHHNQWTYYAAMATLGSVIGGYVTYRLARKGREGDARAPDRSGSRRCVLQQVRALGILGGRGAGSAAPSLSDRSVSVGGRRHAVFPPEVSGGADTGQRLAVTEFWPSSGSCTVGIFFASSTSTPSRRCLCSIAMSMVAGMAALWTYLRYRKSSGAGSESGSHAAERGVA